MILDVNTVTAILMALMAAVTLMIVPFGYLFREWLRLREVLANHEVKFEQVINDMSSLKEATQANAEAISLLIQADIGIAKQIECSIEKSTKALTKQFETLIRAVKAETKNEIITSQSQ